MSEEKKKVTRKQEKKEPIKRVPLVTGLIFMLIGSVCLIYVFVSAELVQATYATMTVAFFGFGLNSLDKSGIFER